MKSKAKKSAATQVRAYDYDVIVSPVITEKSTAASEQNKVLFNVRLDATKTDIKRAIEALFSVKVTKVNTLRRLGKTKPSATPSASIPTPKKRSLPWPQVSRST